MIGAAVAQALKDAEYAVDWVQDGQSAIEAAHAETYDLSLLDLGRATSGRHPRIARLPEDEPPVACHHRDACDSIDDRIQGLDLGTEDCRRPDLDLCPR